MLVVLRRTFFLDHLLWSIFQLSSHITSHKLPARPLRAASMYCFSPPVLWLVGDPQASISMLCLNLIFPCLTVNLLSPLGVHHLGLHFWCTSLEIWEVDICEERIYSYIPRWNFEIKFCITLHIKPEEETYKFWKILP